MPHLLCAPDKFRGTASAPVVAAAAARAARAAGWTADELPLADGGEGLLEAVGGETRRTTVRGPFGDPVVARWQLVAEPPGGGGPVAVIEMAEAAGRALVPHPAGDDPLRAGTAGVGDLLLDAVAAGARRLVVGCGGSATTDGGWGMVEVVGSPEALNGAELVVACDVTTAFRDAAAVFGPQKGATPTQVAVLAERLAELADAYRRRFGVDVDSVVGAGAAGGLAGGLAALGARLVPGFELVATLVGLTERLARADAVVTGEGHLDLPSFAGKVVGGVLDRAGGRLPVLCVVGDGDLDAVSRARAAGTGDAPVEVVRLVARDGAGRARADTAALVEEVVAGWLALLEAGPALAPPGHHRP